MDYKRGNYSRLQNDIYMFLVQTNLVGESVDEDGNLVDEARRIAVEEEYQVWDSWADFGRDSFYSEFGIGEIPEFIESGLEACLDWDAFGKYVHDDSTVFEIDGKVVYFYSI